MTTKRRSLVGRTLRVRWVDSFGTSGWQDLGHDLIENLEIDTLGVVLHECSTSLVLTSTVSGHGNRLESIQIPKCAIVWTEPLALRTPLVWDFKRGKINLASAATQRAKRGRR